MDYEEDEEYNSRGSDRKQIKTLLIDFKASLQIISEFIT